MNATLSPLQVLLLTLAGWVNRHQQRGHRVRGRGEPGPQGPTEGAPPPADRDQRRRLAAKGRRLSRRVLRQVATIVTQDTILRWHRQPIARKWTFTPKRPGRPGIMREISSLILQMATENPGWGYTRIQGGAEEPGPRRGPEYGRQGAQGQRHLVGAGPAVILADVPAGPLGRDRGARPRACWSTRDADRREHPPNRARRAAAQPDSLTRRIAARVTSCTARSSWPLRSVAVPTLARRSYPYDLSGNAEAEQRPN